MDDTTPDNLIPLPRIERASDAPLPLDGEKFVTFLRKLEQEPWIVTEPDGTPVAVESQVGYATFRIRLDLVGEYGVNLGDLGRLNLNAAYTFNKTKVTKLKATGTYKFVDDSGKCVNRKTFTAKYAQGG